MPNYDLECHGCGHAYEEFQTMNTPESHKCPKCGKKKAHRVFRKAVGTVNNYPDGHVRKTRGRGY